MNTAKIGKIELGDKIYARLTLAGGQVKEMMMESVGSFTELLSELRYIARGNRGLSQLYVRNLTRGWSRQQPLMLYHTRLSAQPVATPAAAAPRRMLFPWETH